EPAGPAPTTMTSASSWLLRTPTTRSTLVLVSYPTARDPTGDRARAKAPNLPSRIGPRCLGYPVNAPDETTAGPGDPAKFRRFYATRICANCLWGHPVGRRDSARWD